MKTTIKDLSDILADKISTPIFDTLIELNKVDQERNENVGGNKNDKIQTRQEIVKDYIHDALDGLISYTDQYNEKEIDLNELDFEKMDDYLSEWADGQIEIYNYYVWKRAEILQDYIEDAISEFGGDLSDGIIKLFQLG
jgi:hypothetical protein